MSSHHVMPSVLLENVVQLIHSKVAPEQAKPIEQLASRLYRQLSKEDLFQRSDSDLYGAVLSLWNLLNQTPQHQHQIQVFHPNQATHGWQSSHSVIEIIHPDMPFLVDSIRMAISRLGLTVHMMVHAPIAITRDEASVSQISSLKDAAPEMERVAVFSIEIDRQISPQEITELETELSSVLADVKAAVKDWQSMSAKLTQMIEDLPERPYPGQAAELEEATAFLTYLNNHHFTLLGYRYYELKRVEGDVELVPDYASSLGLMSKSDKRTEKGRLLSSLSAFARKEALDESLLILTKGSAKSRVHRPAYVDYIGIKRFDQQGQVIGEDRFLGLYAANLYNRSPREIPLLAEKIERVLQRSELAPRSHDYKALVNILENLPRDELIQASIDDLYQVARGVLQMQDRDKLKLFVRRDGFGRFFSCLVYVAKDRYNTELRETTQKILAKHLQSDYDVEFTTYFSESNLARTHYIVKVDNNEMDVDVEAMQADLIEAAHSWEDKLTKALNSALGDDQGAHLSKKYLHAFPRSYKVDVFPSSAVVDIQQLESLVDEQDLGMLFYQPQENKGQDERVRLKLFHKDEPIHLSDVLPMLENFGLRIINERPYEIFTQNQETYWVLDFLMMLKSQKSNANLMDSQQRFQSALAQVWHKQLEDDGFNKLVLATQMTGEQVSVIRAYAKYMRQIDATFSQAYIEQTFARYPHLAQLLVDMFIRKFAPEISDRDLTNLQAQVERHLDDVASLDDDRIIRRYLDLIHATLRTNFYQTNSAGKSKGYTSFKFAPHLIPEMPKPLPKFEIFVYSPRVEGVHLRGGKVARGGLRWSDRREDFRTEVLGLVKAQQVKNTVIVPVGAKGGFVCKQLDHEAGREQIFEEGQHCYRLFIRGLLDITDNIINGELVPPPQVVRHDEDDPYLVVAADKGTATFSDIANSIAIEYNFWLGDAFASGGSNGYDHKKMGITAKGAWESVKRHFREMDIDCQSTPFRCLAIGDMAGDVFGNGMLLSRYTCLVAAFNHQHIFIDPTPNHETSYQERQRLFDLPRSSWTDYDQSLISQGGGIFNRSAKSITLTPEIQQLIGVSQTNMTPNELIRALLQAEVDLIWNGGIGTYIKAKSETHAEVGDRANDVLRVDGHQVKAKIIGEGGNLGCTQLGRLEYTMHGGRMNTDFIDNVGGVDCSDNEVNIKILLNGLVAAGEMTMKQRNELLEEMTDEVAEIVLQDCKDQTRTISITEFEGISQLKEQIRFIHFLEKEGKLDRALEFLPSDDELAERQIKDQPLTRPELSVLTAYAKMVLKEQLVTAEITDDQWLSQLLVAYFPQKLQQHYKAQMVDHPLRGEIIATSLANEVVNDMGLNFIQRMQDETGASVAEAAISYTIAKEVFGLAAFTEAITGLTQVNALVQAQMLHQLRRNVRRACRWLVRHRPRDLSIANSIAFFKPVFEQLRSEVSHYIVPQEVAVLKAQAQGFIDQGVPEELAVFIANLSTLFSALDIAQIVQNENKSVPLVAETYFKLGAKVELHWFLEQIIAQPVTNHWQALARAAFREELDWQQRALTAVVLSTCTAQCSAEDIIGQWIDENQVLLSRWHHLLDDFKTSQSHEFAKFSVALRELNLLILHCEGKK